MVPTLRYFLMKVWWTLRVFFALDTLESSNYLLEIKLMAIIEIDFLFKLTFFFY